MIATKVGLQWAHGKVTRNSTTARIQQEVEDSLRRLRVDSIDLYQVHWPDAHVPIDETARALESLLKAGKVRAIGVSNYSRPQMDAWRKVAPLHTCQPPYNLFERGIEKDVLPYCAQHNIITLLYGPLCRGLLSGRMGRATRFPDDDLRRYDPKFQPPRYQHYLEAVQRLDALARESGHTVLELAVRWVLDQPGASIALWGARKPKQLAPVAAAMGWSVDDGMKQEVDRILGECIPDPVGPEFMAPPEG